MTDLSKNVFTAAEQPPENGKPEVETRDLGLPAEPLISATEMKRKKSSKHQLLPWMIAFHISGTSHIVQTQVVNHMIVGRKDSSTASFPKIDLAPYDADLLGVSRRHLEVIVEDNTLKVKDCGSVNGTWLNGKRLLPDQAVPLLHGDEIDLGRMRLRVGYAILTFGDEIGMRFGVSPLS